MNDLNNLNKEITPRGENKVLSVARGLFYFALYFGVQIVVSIVAEIVILVNYVAGDGDLDPDIMMNALIDSVNKNAMLLTIVFDLIFLGILALFILLTKKSPAKEENRGLFTKIKPISALLALLIGITGNYALNIVMAYAQMLFPKLFEQYDSATEVYTMGGIIPYIIGGVILAPIVEELVFRGFMQTRFSRAMPTTAAIVAAGLIFGIIHGNVVQAVYAAALGILLGEIFAHSRSIYASIICHFGFNLSSLPGFFASLEGSTLDESAIFNAIFTIFSYIAPLLLVVFLSLFFKKDKKSQGSDDLSLTKE